ncbi:hypothetical protein ABVT39_015587 [Epinephelus coioides]
MKGSQSLQLDQRIKKQDMNPGENRGFEEVGHSKIANSCANFTANLDCSDVTKRIQLLTNSWEETTNCCDKTEMYNRLMGLLPSKGEEDGNDAVCSDTVRQWHIKDFKRREPERDKQFAYAMVLLKDNSRKDFAAVHPEFQNQKKESGALRTKADQSRPTIRAATHSEEIVIKQLDDYLQHNGTMVKHILIYTLNSPCLKRGDQIVPCMFQLLHKAHEWRQHYDVCTDVAFTKFWGLSGPNYFKYLNYSTISCPSSSFHSHIVKCKDVHFKLDPKNLRDIFNKSDISNILSHVKDTDKNTLRRGITSARKKLVNLAETLFGLHGDHLDRGKQTIDSLTFLPAVQHKVCEKLQEQWKEMVNKSSMTPIREYITEEFNCAAVHHFREQLKSFLGNSSPLQLHRIPRRSPNSLSRDWGGGIEPN